MKQTTIQPTPAKPRDVQVAEIGTNTEVLRSRVWERLKFEVEYSHQKGTTSNSYLIQADKTALIDPPDNLLHKFTSKLYHSISTGKS